MKLARFDAKALLLNELTSPASAKSAVTTALYLPPGLSGGGDGGGGDGG